MARVHLDLPDHFLFSTQIPIRISDINYGGHLGNDAVLSLIHEARMKFFQQYGLSELNIDGMGIVITDVVIIYTSEGFYGDVLNLEVTPDDMNKYGCDLFYRLTNIQNGREVARSKTGIVFLDYNTRKVVRIPETFKTLFFPNP